MKVLVIGANGQIGRLLLEKLQADDRFEVVAALRKESQRKAYEAEGFTTAYIDLEKDITHMVEAMQGIDAVIFAAGSGGKTGADKTILVDLDGAVKAVESAKQAKIDRFVMISGDRTHKREYWSYNYGENQTASYYFAAKYYADEWLKNSGVNYTIIRPTLLLNEVGTGKITAGETLEENDYGLEISREDVAETIIETLGNEKAVNKAFSITKGDMPIGEALDNLS